MTIPVIPQKSRKGKLFEPLATKCSTTTSGTCCICAQQHNSNRWKKRSFTLTEQGIKLASVMMERNLVGNICCNSSYVVLYNYYHTEEGKKKVDALKLTNQKQTKPNRTKSSPTESNMKQLRITKLVPILPKSTEIIPVSTIESPLDLLHNQVEKDFASPELTQKEKRENSLLNINDPSGTTTLNLSKVFECFEELKPPSFTLEMGLKEDRKYPLHIRYKVALLLAKFDIGSQNMFDVVKLIANLPEFGNVKICDSMSHDTVLRCVVEMGLCIRVAIALLMSESIDLIWSCDETEDSSRRFLVFTIHGVFFQSQWHFVVKLIEIIQGTATIILNHFKELLQELNGYQSKLNRKVTKSYQFIGFCSDHASVNTGNKSGILVLFNNLRREEYYTEIDPKHITTLPDCLFMSCVDHTAALASKLAHKKVTNLCNEFKLFNQTTIPQSYQSIVHYITKTISSKFKGIYGNQYSYFQDRWKLKFRSMPYVDDIRYCSVDIVANLIVERLYFFKTIRHVISDKKLADVLMLLDRKEIILMLCVSSSMWTSIYSKYMRSGAIINSTKYYLNYLESFTNIISNLENKNNIFKVTVEITPELFYAYYSSTKSIELNIPAQITCQVQLANKNYSLNYFEQRISNNLLQNNRTLESTSINLALEDSSVQDVESIDISSINSIQLAGQFEDFAVKLMSESLTSMVLYIDHNNSQVRTNINYSEFITVTNRLCERSFGTVKFVLDDNLHTRPLIIESIILIRQFPMDVDISNLSLKLDLQKTAHSLFASQPTRKSISSSKATIELAQAQKEQQKLNDKEINQLNGKITQQLLKRCGVTIHTKEKLFTNGWYAAVVDDLRKFYKKEKKKKPTFRKKSDYVHYLSQLALEEENLLWKQGLPSSQSSSQSLFIIEEPSTQ